VDNYRSFVTLPWALVADLPLFNLARTPGRFNFTLALALATLAGYGAAYVWHWVEQVGAKRSNLWLPLPLRPIRLILFAGLMALIAFEYQTFFPLPTIPAAIPDEVSALSERDDVRAIFGIPWDNLVAAKYDLYLQTAHEHPLIAGQVSRRTPVNPARLTILETTLDPALLHQAGADIVILHKEQDDGTLRARAVEHLGNPFYENERIALFETPDTDATPALTILPTLLDEVETRADSYLYSPEPGWVTLSANVAADGRELVLLRDNTPIHRWMVNGEQSITVPVPVAPLLVGANTSYHTLSLAVEPPCPIYIGVGQECRAVEVSDLQFGPLIPRGESFFSSTFRAPDEEESLWVLPYVPPTANAGETLPVWLYWNFITPRSETDVRYVHLVSREAQGQPPVAQIDSSLGGIPAGSQWSEQVDISLPADLPPGEYYVLTGWYTYPEIQNFHVIYDSTGSTSAFIGTVQVVAE
jgi:hypothetical protein